MIFLGHYSSFNSIHSFKKENLGLFIFHWLFWLCQADSCFCYYFKHAVLSHTVFFVFVCLFVISFYLNLCGFKLCLSPPLIVITDIYHILGYQECLFMKSQHFLIFAAAK